MTTDPQLAGRPRSTLIGRIHDTHVAGRRVRRLVDHLAPLFPPGAHVLDVGCGDGTMARCLMERRPDIMVRGLDVLARPKAAIPVELFDGSRLPVADGGVDTAMFVDVLHHTDDPSVLLREARRVSRRNVVLKDHASDGILARPSLRLMDWVGNAHHGVALPFNYWSSDRWRREFVALGLAVDYWTQALALYPAPASLLFDRSLHFVAALRPVTPR